MPQPLGGRALDVLKPDPARGRRPDPDERTLLAAARRGDRRAAGRLLTRLGPSVLRFGRTFCRNDHDAQDLTQDVLRTLLTELPRFRGDSALSTWAYTVARRACARRKQRESRLQPLESMPQLLHRQDPHPDPHTLAERGQLGDAIARALAELPPAHREVVLLRDVEGLPAAEVANVLGIGERAVKSRLHRARLALRERLAPHAASRGPARECPDTPGLLSRYLEGDVDASMCDELARHVADCAECSAACQDLREVLGACRRWGSAPLPPEQRERVRAAIRRALGGGEPPLSAPSA